MKKTFTRWLLATCLTGAFATVFATVFATALATFSAAALAQAAAAAGKGAARVDDTSMRSNAATSRDWPSYGLDYAETRFSKLKQVDTSNVQRLGLA